VRTAGKPAAGAALPVAASPQRRPQRHR
jgi:hypothetical protein